MNKQSQRNAELQLIAMMMKQMLMIQSSSMMMETQMK
jgi:hypothetical protein